MFKLLLELLDRLAMPLWIRGILIAITALAISASGPAYAVWWSNDADDGGRAGSIVVALSFCFLFLGNRTSSRVYEILAEEAELFSEEKPDRVRALKAQIDTQRHEESEKSVLLAISSVIGTIFWGFGDVVASWFLS